MSRGTSRHPTWQRPVHDAVTDDIARRHVSEGRLTITALGPRHIEATVRDGQQERSVVHRFGLTRCTCGATGRCSHVAALALVVDIPKENNR